MKQPKKFKKKFFLEDGMTGSWNGSCKYFINLFYTLNNDNLYYIMKLYIIFL